MKMSRTWAMPSKETFSIAPIGDFVQHYIRESRISIDPFARNCEWATYTNDLNPKTTAQYHIDTYDFLAKMRDDGIEPDLILFDPPYSPTQIKMSYEGIGRITTSKDVQRPGRWAEERDIIDQILTRDGIVLSFGWNTCGMGKGRGYKIKEILLVCHGAGHNDTICMAERKVTHQATFLKGKDDRS